jgi:hypothetical protein
MKRCSEVDAADAGDYDVVACFGSTRWACCAAAVGVCARPARAGKGRDTQRMLCQHIALRAVGISHRSQQKRNSCCKATVLICRYGTYLGQCWSTALRQHC